MTLRGEGMETIDGFRERTPAEFPVDFHADYGFDFGGRRLMLIGDVFNLFNRRIALDYDNWFETTPGTLNPNFGYAANGGGSSLKPGGSSGAAGAPSTGGFVFSPCRVRRNSQPAERAAAASSICRTGGRTAVSSPLPPRTAATTATAAAAPTSHTTT